MTILHFCADFRAAAAIRGALSLSAMAALTLGTGCSEDKVASGQQLLTAPGPEGTPSLRRQPSDVVGGGSVTCPGAAGCPCVTGDDCSTLCVETAEGGMCARSCEGDCADAFVCAQRIVPGADNVFLCLPRWARLCEPCKDSAMCAGAVGSQNAVCVDYGGKNGAFCGAACALDADCPEGYTCGEATTIEGQTSRQCLRKPEADGSIHCPCDDRAVKNELATVCYADLVNGACPGDRWCTPEGLTDCSAGPLEICDGKDNDCNGDTDDAVCDDKNPCTEDACAVASGLCLHGDSTATCDDGNPCTLATVCAKGACGGGGALDCDDGNPCSADTCGAQGCVHTLQTGTPCDDGDACTVADACLSGGCAAGAQKSCDDANLCSSDSCDPVTGICHFENNPLACDDGSECTIDDTCSKGTCGGAPAQCDDNNLCTSDACDPKVGCTHKANLLPCDDGNSCTVSDACSQGACKPGNLLDTAACDDGNPCTSDGCAPKLGCTHVNAAGACNDGNPCTKNDACVAGGCAPGLNTCACAVDADCAKQDDANKCNGSLYCDKSGPDWQCKISPATVVTCDASSDSACTKNYCDPADGQCGFIFLNQGKPCDADGSACTVGDVCSSGKCAAGAALPCDDGNVCTTDACDPVAGCKFLTNNAPCSDGNGCTVGDLCKGNACTPGVATVCSDENPCTTDACAVTTGTCVFQANSLTCDDGNACSQGDACQAGACVGSAVQCDDDNLCTNDSCDPKGGCLHANNTIACSDGNPCTVQDACAASVCLGTATSAQTLCDDSNLCTTDGCDAKLGCTHAPNTASCDDGNGCTIGDTCAGGGCASGTNICSCVVDLDCAGQEDGNLCNGTLFCDKTSLPYGCKVNPKTVVSCDGSADTLCAHNQCNQTSGKCGYLPINDGKSCNADTSVCTVGDVCQAGACKTGATMDCNDNNVCSDDWCDPVQGCKHAANSAPCSDGSACTVGDICNNNACMAGPAQICNDSNPCTTDGCDQASGKCAFVNNVNPCDDDNACTQGDGCSKGLCSGAALQCSDGNVCTHDTCNPAAGCVHLANNLSCSDGNACTANDLCAGGGCKGSLADPAVLCDDGNLCTSDACSPGVGCVHVNTGTPCDDGNACTAGDACSAGKCVSGSNSCACASDLDCAGQEDGNLCNGTLFCDKVQLPYACKVKPGTVVACDGSADSVCVRTTCAKATGQCGQVSLNEGGFCDADNSVCTVGDACQAGACVAGAAADCDDGNPCTSDVCDPAGGCVQKVNTLPCADGNPCTVGDLCIGGACVPGPAKVCNDGIFCTDDSCSALTGSCAAVPSTKACDDGNACTQSDKCSGGACTGASLNCDDGNPCSNDSCNPASGCVNAANSSPCSDGNACTELDVCQNGQCTGASPKACNDGNPCTADACNPASGCIFVANQSPCDDGNACTGGDVCTNKACAGKAATCNDNQPCTTDSCNPGSGCVFSANALPCSDGNACTLGDSCQGGACKAGASLDCNDGNGCTTDTCDAKLGCVTVNHSNACNDGNGCTVGDVCSGGACLPGTNTCGCSSDADCTGQEDGNLCNGKLFCDKTALPYKCSVNPATVIACSTALDGFCQQNQCKPANGLCILTPLHEGLACDADGSVCTPGDVCQGGKCTVGAALNCDDGNACTSDACNGLTGCQFTANTAACQDGNGCTLGDQCKSGACVAGASTKCDDGNTCTIDSCNASNGTCVFNGTPLGGVSCDADGSLCTKSDACQNGTCVAGSLLNCDDGNTCTADACQATSGCSNTAISSPCDDGTGCTVGDACHGGICTAGAPLQTVTTVPVVMTESGAGKVDVILWIDSSGSMSQEALFVNQNITAFMQYLAEAGLDYHLVLIGSGQNLCQTGCPANPRFLWVKQQVNSTNGLSVLLNTYPLYEAFLRADAVKNIIAVSDDESAMTPATFKLQILTKPKFAPLAIAPLGFVYHSIVAFDPAHPDNGNICSTGAKYGKNHLQLTKDTGGAKYPVCATDWKPIFADLAKTVVKTVFAVCDYAIQVPPGVVFDAVALKLSYVEPGTTEQVVPLVQVSGLAGCTAQPAGYYYDNPLAPKAIYVCSPQCKVMVSSGSLKMDFGCE